MDSMRNHVNAQTTSSSVCYSLMGFGFSSHKSLGICCAIFCVARNGTQTITALIIEDLGQYSKGLFGSFLDLTIISSYKLSIFMCLKFSQSNHTPNTYPLNLDRVYSSITLNSLVTSPNYKYQITALFINFQSFHWRDEDVFQLVENLSSLYACVQPQTI